jgi:hypothetical protein
MIMYNVTVNVDEDAHDEWLKWMKEVHIPDMLSTGLFTEGKIARILAEEAGGLAYSVQYFSRNMEDYETYIARHSQTMREDHDKKFGGKYVAFRTLLQVVHTSNG